MAKRTPGGGKRKKATRTRPRILPNCRAILICEKVIKDALFGTITLVGVLTRFQITAFPGETLPFFMFAQLAHGLGKYGVTVEVQDDRDGLVIGRSPVMLLEFAYRTEVHDIIFQIPGVTLTHSGSYTVAILVNGNELAKQNFDTPEKSEEQE